MKIAALTYDFPHPRTAEMLLDMACAGFKPDTLICQPWQTLKLRRSITPTSPRAQTVAPTPKPKRMCEALGIEYIRAKHAAAGPLALFRGFDLGVVLGARIIPQDVIEAFKIGILNIHPGLLPFNRGLDAVKWAVHGFTKQGVTAHLIDGSVDAGRIVWREQLDGVRPTDTLIDVAAQVRVLERQTLLLALTEIGNGNRGQSLPQVPSCLHGTMPPAVEAEMLARWPVYVAGYARWKGVDE